MPRCKSCTSSSLQGTKGLEKMLSSCTFPTKGLFLKSFWLSKEQHNNFIQGGGLISRGGMGGETMHVPESLKQLQM